MAEGDATKKQKRMVVGFNWLTEQGLQHERSVAVGDEDIEAPEVLRDAAVGFPIQVTIASTRRLLYSEWWGAKPGEAIGAEVKEGVLSILIAGKIRHAYAPGVWREVQFDQD
ncbi:hypothetical protein [Intrasporangium flavum]|uniref:hypothetical protein n=1 Tax=Intrasporangium flavum TaxID=1428657 RepID=UPI00096FBDD0|nr:hypothetical protein [Intrasporangium flavum]